LNGEGYCGGIKMSILSDEFIKRQVEILKVIEDILKKEGDRINNTWLCDEPIVITVGTYKYVHYSIYIYSDPLLFYAQSALKHNIHYGII
jgi:hypothetical protein